MDEQQHSAINSNVLLSLPGFVEAKAYLEDSGRPSGWITATVDTSDPAAQYLKAGKPWYKSACPFYQGFWLSGCIGSVACERTGLLPGLMWQHTCRNQHEQCPFFLKKDAAEIKKGE